MIVTQQERCTACGICVEICHEGCMTLNDRELVINHPFCSHCTQCIAVCPFQALSWDEVLPQPFDNQQLPDQDQVAELLQQRRTIRQFKNQIPDRELIEKVTQMGIHAPRHNQDFRAVLVDDPRILDALDQATYQNVKKIYRWLFKPPWIPLLVSLLSPANQREFRKARPKLEHLLRIERGYQSLPPVLVFLVSKKRVPLSLESAQYTLFAIDLYARTWGLGCRILVGNQSFFNRSRVVRKLLELDPDERIYAVAGLGYPAVKFRNKVAGKNISILWAESEGQGISPII